MWWYCIKQSLDEKSIAIALNKVAREQMKYRIYQDILIDMIICEIEGWNKKEYIYELQEMLNSIKV